MQQAREPKVLGKYHLIASLGQGGMAKVYLALMAGPAGFNKLLVVKVLREDLLDGSTEGVKMFWEEARLAARLNHPNIVQTLEVGEFNGRYFIAMEYLDGQPYSALLRHAQKEPIALSEHLRIISSTARALHYLHSLRSYQGASLATVHRDVSPHNIFVTYEGEVKLLDFGVATTEDPEHFTRIGVIKGKLDYIAPEQLRAEPLDGRADIYALGAVLWEAVCGLRFAGGRKVPDAIKIQARLGGGERRIRQVVPTVAAELEQIIEQAISLDPALRFRDAGQFADAIDAYIDALGARPSAMSLARTLDPIFSLERSRTHALIDEQLQVSKRTSAPHEGADWTKSLPSLARASAEEGSSLNAAGSRYTAGGASGSELAPAKGIRPSGVEAPRSGRSMLVASAVALATGASLTLAWSWPRSDAKPMVVDLPVAQSAEGAPKPAASMIPPSSLPGPASVRDTPAAPLQVDNALLQIEVSPASATVTIDGAAVSTPFSGTLRKDSSMHLVEVSADGFRGIKQFVKLDRDQRLSLSLSRATTASRRSSAGDRRGQSEVPAPMAAPFVVAAPVKAVATPGADIELSTPPARDDGIDQINPYRSSR